MLVDSYGREITNLRISVTQRCNLNCFYCHREGEQKAVGEMSAGEISRICSIASKLGIKKLKITGGEPLMRDDIVDIISKCSNYFEEISMTTNGTLLACLAPRLKRAGLSRVNVSLDTLNRSVYRKITGQDLLSEVLDGIGKSIEAGLTPVKINTVVMKGINEMEIDELMKYSKSVGAILQLIELETQKERVNERFFKDYYCSLEPIEKRLESIALKIVARDLHKRKKYYLPEEVEIVRPMHNTAFCAHCHRLRITSDGYLKPCLLREDGNVDLISALRRNSSDDELINLFKIAVAKREPYWR
ncbi:MAG: GTP 3',8-cyclase MoaA [Methanomassiliicoccales archaeon]